MPFISPGHGWMLHLESWVESPGHGRPLLAGAGLLQKRTLVRSPIPQEAEHSPHGCHGLQLPSTIRPTNIQLTTVLKEQCEKNKQNPPDITFLLSEGKHHVKTLVVTTSKPKMTFFSI